MDGILDAEIRAMAAISEALSGLEEEPRARVLRWAAERFALRLPAVTLAERASPAPTPVPQGAGSERSMAFSSFPDLFDAANPASGLERILVAAYWFQVVQSTDDFDSYEVNRELKNLGHPSGNITRDLSALMARTPRLVLQIRKDGSTKQARKRYRLTREGSREVERMLGMQ